MTMLLSTVQWLHRDRPGRAAAGSGGVTTVTVYAAVTVPVAADSDSESGPTGQLAGPGHWQARAWHCH
jgi:hypothetical protein